MKTFKRIGAVAIALAGLGFLFGPTDIHLGFGVLALGLALIAA